MRVAIVCFPHFGGSGVVATELAIYLAKKGVKVFIVCKDKPRRLGDNNDVHFVKINLQPYPLFSQGLYTCAVAESIAKLIYREKLDIVNVHYALPHGLSAILARDIVSNTDIKVVTTVHGTEVALENIREAYKNVISFILRSSDKVTTVSKDLDNKIKSYFQIDDTVVIPNFVDYFRFKPYPPDKREKSVVYISSFREVKNPLRVVPIFERVAQFVNDAKLVIVGDGPLLARVKDSVEKSKLKDKVYFVGQVVRVEDILSKARVLLLTSAYESFGLVALEAQSCGVPVVAYNVGGLPEVVINEKTGYLVPYSNDTLMVEKIKNLLLDDQIFTSFSKNCRKHVVNNFDYSKTAYKYFSLFNSLVK